MIEYFVESNGQWKLTHSVLKCVLKGKNVNSFYQCILLSNLSKFTSYILSVALLLIANTALAELPTQHMVDEQISFLNQETDTASIDLLNKIKSDLSQISELERENSQFRVLLEEAPERKIALRKEFQKLVIRQPEDVSKSSIATELEQRLATEKARNKELNEQFIELKKQQQSLLEAQETLPIAIAEQEQINAKQIKEDKIIKELTDTKIGKWSSTVRQVLQDKRLKGLILQQDTLMQRRELVKLNVQILDYQLVLGNKKIELLQERLLEVSTKSSLKVIEKAKQLTRALVDAPEFIQQWNVKNEALAVEFEALNRQLLLSQQERQKLDEQRQRVTQNLAQIKGNIKWLKNSPSFSDAISVQLGLLPDLSDKTDLAKAITDAHLRHFQLSAELEQLKDIPSLINGIANTETLNKLYEKALSSILNFRYEVLSDALEKTDQFISEITRLDALQDQFNTEILAERDFLREKRLFIRDRSMLWSLSFFDMSVWLGTSHIFERISTLIKKLASYTGELFALGVFFVFIAGIIVQFRKAEKGYRLAYVKTVGRVRKDTILSSLILFALAISNGALVAVCLLVIDYWIKMRLESYYSYDLSHIFISASVLVFVWESLVRMAIPDGLLQTHLGHAKTVVQWLKLSLSKQRWILYSFLMMILVSEMLAEGSNNLLLRILFILLLVWLIACTLALIKRNHLPVLLPRVFQSKTSLQILRIVLVLPLVSMIILAIWGYLYTSWVMSLYYYIILLCLLSAGLFQQLGVRWLEIEQKRISLQRALDKRAELLKRDKQDHLLEEIDESVIPVEEIGEQSLTLLNISVLVILFIALSTVLSDSLLAFHWMDDVTIWDVVTVTETGSIVEAISLKSLLSALISLGLSFFLAKNLPGVLELLLLHRLNIAPGTTYAMNTLLRYAIVLSGFLIAVSILGFHWSRLQWLVAALSVGLGFGLQEIFANLVSGIILLFERPVRVGDTITIQNLTGQVTKINTRATTILDWDEKEIIVPNKSLITEQLVNWSLSDSMTRVILPIGVAYGSDVDLVKKSLLQAAEECEEICQQPSPSAYFLAFGASSLDFELRIYLPKVEGRSFIKDKLNSRIDQLFREHNIEIPFPQMDIRVKELPIKG